MDTRLENEDIQKIYEDSILNEATKGIRRKVQLLDDKIDDFIDDIEKKIEKIEDNPTYQNKLYQMLADANKEHSEFLMAMKRIASTIDSDGKTIPKVAGHANFMKRGAFQPEMPPEDGNGPPGNEPNDQDGPPQNGNLSEVNSGGDVKGNIEVLDSGSLRLVMWTSGTKTIILKMKPVELKPGKKIPARANVIWN
jgi:hypothetical protein